MDTYAQLQEIRTYYKFHDVDVDRYQLDGAYQGVTLSARELKPALLPPNAQTWVNSHVLFTHGNGAVMSPLARKTAKGCRSSTCRTSRRSRPAARRSTNRASTSGKRPTPMSSSREARQSSTIPRGQTTSTRPMQARAGSPWAGSREEPSSRGISRTRTCCSPATSPATVGSCSAVPFRTGYGRLPLSSASTGTPIW